MAVRPVLKMGHPILQQTAAPVTDFDDPKLAAIVGDMFDTMAALNGAGLAAPQIGESIQLVIFQVANNSRYPTAEAVPKTILINPTITPLSDTQVDDWEGCLSIPGMRGLVPRYQSIRYTGYDLNGTPLAIEASDFHARVVQHEVDHLFGILYPQRIKDLRYFGFESELFPADLS